MANRANAIYGRKLYAFTLLFGKPAKVVDEFRTRKRVEFTRTISRIADENAYEGSSVQVGMPGDIRNMVFFSTIGDLIRACLPTAHVLEENLICPVVLKVTVGALNKGDAVRYFFSYFLEHVGLESQDVLLYIDGEGIPLSWLEEATRALDKYGVDVVLAARISPYWGVSPSRALIELLELYIISRAMGLRQLLPDGQCGAWGVRGHVVEEIVEDLRASRYGIELDILIEVLKHCYDIAFVPVEVEKELEKELEEKEEGAEEETREEE